MDCGEYGATCRRNVSDRLRAVCVFDNRQCADPDVEKCGSSGIYLEGCSAEVDGVPYVADVGYSGSPYCIEKADGTFEFNRYEGTCLDDEARCTDELEVLQCINGIWAFDYSCLDADRTNVECIEEIIENKRYAKCENTVACNAETGEFGVCAIEDSRQAAIRCKQERWNDDDVWYWEHSFCADPEAKCYTTTEGVAYCTRYPR